MSSLFIGGRTSVLWKETCILCLVWATDKRIWTGLLIVQRKITLAQKFKILKVEVGINGQRETTLAKKLKCWMFGLLTPKIKRNNINILLQYARFIMNELC